MADHQPIFVWRDTESKGPGSPGGAMQQRPATAGGIGGGCPLCGEAVIRNEARGFGNLDLSLFCGFCGWGFKHQRAAHFRGEGKHRRILRSLPIESAELSLGELRTAIAARPERAAQLPSRRFEELVGDVFANEGYRVELTRPTRDGGRDLIVLRESDEIEAIVEVKRHKQRVGVDLVRQLRGVQIRDNAPYAILVATTGFSKEAHAEAAARVPAAMGFTLDLYDINDLLRAMDTLAEPVESPSALERSRERYRAWLEENLGEQATPPRSLFDIDAAWGD